MSKKKKQKKIVLPFGLALCVTFPIVSNKVALKEAAVRMTCGKLVAPGTKLENWVPGPT